MSEDQDVTGVWYGGWHSDDPDIYPNSFIALLDELAGSVSGIVTEPDRYGRQPLRALVHGSRDESRIHWTKQYDGDGRLAHAVFYSGNVNSDGTEISGTWRLDRYGGSFTMQREKFQAAELEDEREAELDAPVTR